MAKNKKEDLSEKKTAIVKHSNWLADIPFQGFNAYEIELFWGLCYFLQSQKDNEVTIPFSGIRQLLGIKRRGDEKLLDELDTVSKKFSRISFSDRTDKQFIRMTPFIGFKGDSVTKTFTVQAHPDFVDALNGLNGSPGHRYTLSDVKAIVRVKSKFSKQALIKMFVYRDTGYWYVTVDSLRKYLSIPESYVQSNIKRDVIDVMKRDFEESGIFDEVDIIENKDESKKTKGRKKVIGYTFAYKFAATALIEEMLNQDEPVLQCPKCKGPLYRIERKDGTGFFFGHRDGYRKDAKCSYTTNEIIVPSQADQEATDVISDEKGTSIKKGELDRYYRYIRDEEQDAATRRKEYIHANEPDIWALYEEWEGKNFEFREAWMSIRFNIGDQEQREKSRSEIRAARERMEDALESRGYSRDYMDLQYRCQVCKDSGLTDDGLFCACRKERAAEAVEWLKENK